jgi:ArsR family transcriptional regulator
MKDLLEMENLFLALADKTRLRIINLLSSGEVCVCFFTEALQEAQPKISRHLAYLRRSGMVETKREGKWIYYRLAAPKNEHAAQILSELQNWLKNNQQMKKDSERFNAICCQPEKVLIATQRATPGLTTTQEIENPYGNKVKNQKEEALADFML